MGLKDNFSQAFKELTNPNINKDQGRAEIKDVASYMNDNEAQTEQTQPTQATVQPMAQEEERPVQQTPQNNYQQTSFNNSFNSNNNSNNVNSFNGNNVNNNSNNNVNNNNNAYARQNFQQSSAPAVIPNSFGYNDAMRQDTSETTVISKNTIIDGNIRSFADMKIDGSIKGSVETTKNVSVNGKVIGNITCDNAVMKSASVQGNITLKGQVTMTSESMLIGDLSSQVASLNGKMKGNLTVAGKAQLERDAVIFGDIKAGAIAISDGAIIQGYISTTYLSQDESSNIFPESIAIGE